MITTEDIMEEIFGEIEDEHDYEELIEKVEEDGSFVFSARMEIDYLNEKYKIKIPESEKYETLAGFIISVTQDIPNAQEVVEMEDFSIQIIDVSNHRINLVKVIVKRKN